MKGNQGITNPACPESSTLIGSGGGERLTAQREGLTLANISVPGQANNIIIGQ
jgi:hypothetical protein